MPSNNYDNGSENRPLHQAKSSIQICKFFDTPTGCRWGDKCRFSHDAIEIAAAKSGLMGSQHATRGPVVPSKTTQQWLHDSTNTASTSRGKACGYLAEGDSCIYGSRYKFSHHPEDIAAFKAKTARKGKGWAIGGGSGFAIASSEDKGEAVIPETELGTTNPELQASAIKQERLRGRSSELASLEARLIEARRRGFQGKPGKEG